MFENKTVIEFVDSKAGDGSVSLYPDIVLINGARVLVKHNSVQINTDSEEFTSVTLTLIPSKIVFRGNDYGGDE